MPRPQPRIARRPEWRTLALAAIVALALRVAFGLGYWTGQPLTRDEQEYLSLARSLTAGHGFVYDDVMTHASFTPFGRAPGYPAFLAVVGGGRGTVPTSVPAGVKIAQSVVGACGVILIGLVATALAGPRAGTAAAFIGACYPPLVWIAAYALSEAIVWPLGLAVVWLFDAALRRDGDARWMTAAGLVSGIGILVRPAWLLFLPFAAAWLLFKRRPGAIVALAIGSALVVAPWVARNHQTYGRFVLVASDGGVTFWTGNHPLATGDGDMAANPRLKLRTWRCVQHFRAQRRGNGAHLLSRGVRVDRAASARLALARSAQAVSTSPCRLAPPTPTRIRGSTIWRRSSRMRPSSSAASWASSAWAVAGISPGLWCAALSAVAVCLVFFPQERFRIPVIDPTLV